MPPPHLPLLPGLAGAVMGRGVTHEASSAPPNLRDLCPGFIFFWFGELSWLREEPGGEPGCCARSLTGPRHSGLCPSPIVRAPSPAPGSGRGRRCDAAAAAGPGREGGGGGGREGGNRRVSEVRAEASLVAPQRGAQGVTGCTPKRG